jgi:hypothetical protein
MRRVEFHHCLLANLPLEPPRAKRELAGTSNLTSIKLPGPQLNALANPYHTNPSLHRLLEPKMSALRTGAAHIARRARPTGIRTQRRTYASGHGHDEHHHAAGANESLGVGFHH